jgi:hypothetical protein
MSIHDFSWGDVPKDLIFPVNDIVTFSIEKIFDNADPAQPQLALECRVILSEKADDCIGEKVMHYFRFKTKAGTPNKNTYKFLLIFFKDEMENRKRIPYESLIDKQFTAVSEISEHEGKKFQKWSKFSVVDISDKF